MRKSRGYWTKEKCHEEALKYEYRSEFSLKNSACYSRARISKWLDEICSHMNRIGNRFKKCIYVYEFIDTKTVYVGLTYNIKIRNQRHLSFGPIEKYLKIDKKYILKQLTDYIDVKEAINKEEFFVNEYKNAGWCLLNSTKTGAVGSNIRKWTKENCISDAKKYNIKSDYVHNGKSYRYAVKQKWLREIYDICGFEFNISKPRKYWMKQRCKLESKKYDNLKDFRLKGHSSYCICLRNKWLEEIKNYRNWN